MIRKLFTIGQRLERIKKIIWEADGMIPINMAAQFACSEGVEGDYLEFGVFEGESFAEAIASFKRMSLRYSLKRNDPSRAYFEKEIKAKVDVDSPATGVDQPKYMKRRFFAFDSFEGFPVMSGGDAEHPFWKPGRFATSEKSFYENIRRRHPDEIENVVITKGFFSDTLKPSLYEELSLKKASVVMIDSDLYSSCVDVLDFITPLVGGGTVLIFNDWNTFKASPKHGERRAVKEWLAAHGNFYLDYFASRGCHERAFILQVDGDN